VGLEDSLYRHPCKCALL